MESREVRIQRMKDYIAKTSTDFALRIREAEKLDVPDVGVLCGPKEKTNSTADVAQ